MLKEKHPYNLHLNTSLAFSIHICKCYISIGKCFAHFVLHERVSCLLPWVTPRPPLLLPPLLLPPFPPRVCRQPIRQRHIKRRAPSMNEGANKTAIARTTVLDFVWYIQYLTCIHIYIYRCTYQLVDEMKIMNVFRAASPCQDASLWPSMYSTWFMLL